jgi:hypothetical protein
MHFRGKYCIVEDRHSRVRGAPPTSRAHVVDHGRDLLSMLRLFPILRSAHCVQLWPSGACSVLIHLFLFPSLYGFLFHAWFSFRYNLGALVLLLRIVDLCDAAPLRCVNDLCAVAPLF